MSTNHGGRGPARAASPTGAAALLVVSLLAASSWAQTITTLAGSGVAGYCGDGGPASAACLNAPSGLDATSSGVFIADYFNHRIRQVGSGGAITTMAGNGTPGFCGDDGPAVDACLHYPIDVAAGGGVLFIVDRYNHRIRRVSAAGTITTVAGNGSAGFCGDGGPATSACLHYPTGVAVDPAGTLFIADYFNHRIRRVDAATGVITSIAGNGTAAFCGDGGPAAAACLHYPHSVEVDAAGTVFVADQFNHRVRRIDAAGVITTVAGNGTPGFCGDDGPATDACTREPSGLVLSEDGGFLLTDWYTHRVREVGPTGTIATIAGGTSGYCGDGGDPRAACLSGPYGLALDPEGNLYVAEQTGQRVRKVGAAPVGPVLSSLTLKKPIVAGCKPMTGTVTLSAPAPAGGAVVTLSETLASGSVPASVTIPAGATRKTFKVTTAARSDPEMGTVSATYGSTTLTKPLTIRPMSVLSIPITPTTLVGGGVSSGVVKLECKAGPGPILVEFGSTLPDVAGTTVPNVLIPAGVQTAPVTVTTSPVAATKKPKITATANGLTKSKTLTVTP